MAGVCAGGAMYEEDEQQLREVEEYNRSLLPGFQFRPIDEVLVGYYLTRKIKNLWIPPFIREVDLYKYPTPDDLIERCGLIKDRESKWYFFTPITNKSANGNRRSRTTPGGHWKATAGDVAVRGGGLTIGHKKTLCFYQGVKPPKKTNWIMHEFRIGNEKWVVCRVYERYVKSSSGRSENATVEYGRNHANEEQQQNEEVSHAIVPALVNNNVNEQADLFEPMIPSEMVGYGYEPLQQTDQESFCPCFDVDSYFETQQQQNQGVPAAIAPAVVTSNPNGQQDFSAMISPEMAAPGNGNEPLPQTDEDSCCKYFDIDRYLQDRK